jgi:hypothetical protein
MVMRFSDSGACKPVVFLRSGNLFVSHSFSLFKFGAGESDCIVSSDWMAVPNEEERTRKEVAFASFEVIFRHLALGTGKNH